MAEQFPDFEPIAYGYCEGPPIKGRMVTSCDGGRTIFQGRRARWLYRGSRLLCGTCKRRVEVHR